MMIKLRNPILVLWVTFFLAVFVTSPAQAAMMPSQGADPSVRTNADLDSIQRALENKLVIEKLTAYGLTPEEVRSKVKDMTPAQIHMLAQASNDVLAGGDGVGFLIGVLVIIILVIVILKLLGKDVILKMASADTSAHDWLLARG